MIATNYSMARLNFKEFCDKTVNDFETIIITRERGKNVVLMSECEYNKCLKICMCVATSKTITISFNQLNS